MDQIRSMHFNALPSYLGTYSQAVLCALFLMLVSCDESDDAVNGEDNLIGKWELVEFKVFENAENHLLPNAEIILTELIARDCEILTYDFQADGTLIAENNILYIGTDPEDISCPTEVSDIFEGTWQLDGNQLTFFDGDASSADTIEIELTSDFLFLDGKELNAENLFGSEFILKRQ